MDCSNIEIAFNEFLLNLEIRKANFYNIYYLHTRIT